MVVAVPWSRLGLVSRHAPDGVGTRSTAPATIQSHVYICQAQVRRGLGSLWEKRDCTQQAELWWMHVVHRRTAVRICGRAPVPGEKTSD